MTEIRELISYALSGNGKGGVDLRIITRVGPRGSMKVVADDVVQTFDDGDEAEAEMNRLNAPLFESYKARYYPNGYNAG